MTLIQHNRLACLSLFLLAGCAAQATPQPTSTPEDRATSTAIDRACVQPGAWFDPANKRILATPEALARIKDARVVLLGETHVIADHHRWHMQTVAQMHAQHPDMILSFEAFPRRIQPVLDQWVAGALTEAEFLKQSEWETVWKYDANLYLPLFHFARLNAIPMVALNVDRSLINQVSKKGWKAVPKSERGGIGDPAPAPKGYIEMLSQVYGNHDNGSGKDNGAPKGPGLDDPRFASFVDVQLTWDRAMAEATATALKHAHNQGRDPQLIAVIGRGHMDQGYGVPTQLKDLGVDDIKVLVPWDKLRPCEELALTPPPADLIFGLATTEDYLPDETDRPKLGVLLEKTEDGVVVKDVLKDSIAETAGLKADDLILRAANQPLATTNDLVTIIKSMNPGTWLPLTIRRAGKEKEIIARFPVTHP
ncbi:MAG: ChaN family lipoprotein [Rhodospirillales bacterium]|nr:ChaN family lipoprotein [Rhodospirillales bacterium]